MKKIVIVDDCETFGRELQKEIQSRYGDATSVEFYDDAYRAVASFGPDVSLLILDWEMPEFDGKKLLKVAVAKGISKNRVVICSAHTAEDLHGEFGTAECLAVLAKGEERQREVLQMILDSVHRK
jgi:DNA-binding response OmpR family regulator